ncbi:YcaO-like family protein [Pseudomonas folii]|uniref:YcaO-like family protein n=1 Tax=Pseudomonas folii TaxID=2762593 RepID=A0ABR7B6A6_9PSED|nr:YcaO-like family protein [Pseudomonas folii]MBC3952710.1 YcaO-like family protein [Pseudomonas folii]
MFERDFSAISSEEKVLQAASSLGFSFSTEFKNASKTVAVSKLIDNAGVTVSEGAGKGIYCKIGAQAESLEHFALDGNLFTGLVSSAIDDIRNQPSLSMDGLLTNLPKSRTAIDCVEMHDILTGGKVRVPAVIQLPCKELGDKIEAHPELSYLNRYSSNSGLAFGCSENEAILHGLNEVVERHALSKVLMSLCGQHEKLLLKSPSAEILDELFFGQDSLRALVDGMKVLLTHTIYGVYFCMAIPKRPDGRYPVCLIGSGCSVDAGVAIERASTELLQALELFDESERDNDLKAYSLMQRSFKLQPLIDLEVLRNNEYICRRLDPPRKKTVAHQLEYIIEQISATGLRILRRTLLEFDNGCVVTQVYIPGVERFNLVRAGIPVVPQHLLHANRSFS